MADGVKFIRVRGRVVPISGKSSQSKSGISKRYGAKRQTPAGKQIGSARGASIGASVGASVPFAASLLANRRIKGFERFLGRPLPIVTVPTLKGIAKFAAIGALAGAAIGSVKLFKRGKGESNTQLAKRASGVRVNKTGLK